MLEHIVHSGLDESKQKPVIEDTGLTTRDF